MGKLEGKVALITGASGGMGRVTALKFAKEGGNIVVHYSSSEDNAKNIAEEIRGMGSKGLIARADVSKYDEVKSIVDLAIRTFGRVDIVVAYAGFPAKKEYWHTDPLNLTDEMLDDPWNTDLKGSYHCIKAIVPYMRKQRNGKIILISSTPGVSGDPIGLGFTLAKTAVRALVRSLAPVLAPEILINAIAPGSVGTEANLRNYTEEQKNELMKAIPLGRFGRPEEIANLVVFLASDDSSYITGQTIIVDGGEIRL
ncbi:MAG: SDR family NAD(P)-dependent oxidoreductase [Nitrososphaerales archaeon]